MVPVRLSSAGRLAWHLIAQGEDGKKLMHHAGNAFWMVAA